VCVYVAVNAAIWVYATVNATQTVHVCHREKSEGSSSVESSPPPTPCPASDAVIFDASNGLRARTRAQQNQREGEGEGEVTGKGGGDSECVRASDDREGQFEKE